MKNIKYKSNYCYDVRPWCHTKSNTRNPWRKRPQTQTWALGIIRSPEPLINWSEILKVCNKGHHVIWMPRMWTGWNIYAECLWKAVNLVYTLLRMSCTWKPPLFSEVPMSLTPTSGHFKFVSKATFWMCGDNMNDWTDVRWSLKGYRTEKSFLFLMFGNIARVTNDCFVHWKWDKWPK